MFSILALALVFFAKTGIVRSSCNYFELSGFPTAVTSQCSSFGVFSYNSVCLNSTAVEVSSYFNGDCSGTATKQIYTGSTVHCGGDSCYAEIKAGTNCSTFVGTLYIPFDVCIVVNDSFSKVTCSSFSNYTSDTCPSSDTAFSYSLGQCYTQGDGSTLYVSDASGYCDSSLSTTAAATATTTETDAEGCNYFELSGVAIAVTSNCMSLGGASINSKCITSNMVEASFYSNTDCTGTPEKVNYTGYCGGSTCYAEVKTGNNSCSTFSETVFIPFDVCVDFNGTNAKITCSSFSNFTSDSCSSSADYSYSLDKCHSHSDGSTLYVKDGTGYCSIANGLNTNIFRSIVAILFVVYLFH